MMQPSEDTPTEKAQAAFDHQQRITLSERDFAHFVTLIENSPPPTQKLQDAMMEYLRLEAVHPESNL